MRRILRFSTLFAILTIAFIAGTVQATNSTLTVQTCVSTGITPSFAAAPDTIYVANNGATVIEIKNAGSQITATVVSTVTNPPPGTVAYNIPITVAASTGDKIIGPFNQTGYNTASGLVMVILSSKTSVTVAAYKIR